MKHQEGGGRTRAIIHREWRDNIKPLFFHFSRLKTCGMVKKD